MRHNILSVFNFLYLIYIQIYWHLAVLHLISQNLGVRNKFKYKLVYSSNLIYNFFWKATCKVVCYIPFYHFGDESLQLNTHILSQKINIFQYIYLLKTYVACFPKDNLFYTIRWK